MDEPEISEIIERLEKLEKIIPDLILSDLNAVGSRLGRDTTKIEEMRETINIFLEGMEDLINERSLQGTLNRAASILSKSRELFAEINASLVDYQEVGHRTVLKIRRLEK